MAESETKVSSSSDSKEKKSVLDDDIGKEFLSSWKSISTAENNTMDFGFDTIPSSKKCGGKKSAFDFGKLDDMDFSLDNDFGKFNVDLSELDFSSSTKKVAKPKDQREGESFSKNHKEKEGPFNFSFDFNDMDDFNLDSTLTKRETAPKSNLERKIVASDKSELRDFSIDMDLDGRVAVFDEGQNKKVSAPGSVLKSDKSAPRGSSVDLDIDGRVAAFDEGKNKKVSASGSVLKSDESALRGSSMDLDIDGSAAAFDEGQSQKISAPGNVVKSDKIALKASSTDLDIDGRVAAIDEGQNKKVSASGSVLKSDQSVVRGSSIDQDIDGSVAAFDEGKNKKVSASGSVLKPDVETAPVCAENREVSIERSPSNTFGSHTTTSSPDRNRTVSVNKEDKQVPFSTKTSHAVSSTKETSQISLGQSLSGNDSSKDYVSNVQMEVDSLGSKLHPESVLQHSGNDGMITNVGSEHETSELKVSDSPYVTRTEAESDTASAMPSGKRSETESEAHGSEIEPIPAVLAPYISKERTDDNAAEDCTAKISAAPESDQVVEKVKLIKERETGVVRSKFFRRSEEPEPQVCLPLPVNEKASIHESHGTVVLTLNSLGNGKSKGLVGESKIGRNTTGDSKSLSRDFDKGESALVGGEKNVKNLSNIRVGLTETGNGSASKLLAKSRLLEKESNKVNSVMLGSTKLRKDLNNSSKDLGEGESIIGRNTTGDSNSLFRDFDKGESVLVGGEKNVKNLSNIRVGVSETGNESASKLSAKPRLLEKESNKVNSIMLGSTNLREDLNNSSKDLGEGESIIGRNTTGDSKSLSRDFDKGESALVGGEKNIKNLSNIRVGLTETGNGSASKLAAKPRLLEKESNKLNSVMLGSTNLRKDLNNSSKDLGEGESKIGRNTTGVSKSLSRDFDKGESVLVGGEKNIKNLSNIRVGLTETGNGSASKLPAQSRLLEKESNKVNSVMLGSTNFRIDLNNSRESRRAPFLKRKTLEGSTGETVPLNPHKRLSQSPNESRYSTEPIKSVADEQNTTNIVDGNGTTSEQEMPMDVNVRNLEISLTMENDGNAEKAEAYAKELDNICNMLKKKHEEAKEIMVRAIVNNNSLLMLNHPIFDEKIRNVQKLLTKLTMSN